MQQPYGSDPRPEATAPGAMGGARDRPTRLGPNQAWLIFLAVALLLVALWTPFKAWINRALFHPTAPRGPVDARAFVALAYEGVSERTNEISPARFDAQLRLLREHGYTPIGLEEVRAFYQEGRPLPRKAVLTTFEQSRKSSYFDTRRILRANRWKAVMFLWTLPIEDEDPSVLRWPYIRDMILSRTWEVGGQGHDAFRQVPADPNGRLGNFMSTPMWKREEERYETPEEFGRRIEADVKRNYDEIVRQTGVRPLAFAFPYGDFGQYESRAVLTRRLNLDIIAKYYPLGFISGPMALNTAYSDPRRLNRLLVDPRWSAEELLQRLERAWPVRREFRDFTNTLETAWIREWGVAEPRGNHFDLRAAPNTTGAKIWLSGSDLLQNVRTRIRFRLHEGQFSLFLRAQPDGESHLHIGLEPGGLAWIRQKMPGLEAFTLASAQFQASTNEIWTLEVTVRDRLVFVRLNDRLLTESAVRVRGDPAPGMLGVSVWSPRLSAARAQIWNVTVNNDIEQIVKWRPALNRGPYLAWWINQNADRMTVLSPPWAEVTAGGLQIHAGEDIEILRRLARIYDFRICPAVTVESESALDRIQAPRLVDDVVKQGYDGLFLDFTPLDRPSIGRVTQWIRQIADQTTQAALRLMVRFPPVLERTTTFPTVLDLVPEIRLVTSAASPLTRDTTSAGAAMPFMQIPEPTFDLDLALYYEVTGLSETNRPLPKAVQIEMWRQMGHNAFAVGDYDEALRHWGKWLEAEPTSPEALMLIGDVHLRLQALDKALEYYNASLAADPGQIDLALRRAALLDNMNRSEESREALNLYARLFPQNMDVLLAQAEWLNRHGRTEEARALVRSAVQARPDHLKARIRYQLLADDPAERFSNLRRIEAIGTGLMNREGFADLLQTTELLSAPESGLLYPWLARVASEDPDPRIRKRFAKLLPPLQPLREQFVEEGKVSDNWVSSSGEIPTRMGRLYLRAAGAQTEAYLRMNGSEGLRNGFIEVTLEDVRGFFWLYARRGPTTMIRFGFDQTGLYLQVWKHGNLLANESRLWRPSNRAFAMRLEVVGDGAMGYVEGEPAFDAPVTVPPDLMNGWWGVAPFSFVPGQAQVVIKALAAGPLPTYLAIPSVAVLRNEEALLDQLKAGIRTFSAVAPPWFRQAVEGGMAGAPGSELTLLRMFCQYHRKRLMPAVYLGSNAKLPGEWIVRTAAQYSLGGFCLIFPEMPTERWISDLRAEIETSDLCVLAIESTPENPFAKVREVTVKRGLFLPVRSEWPLRVYPLSFVLEQNRLKDFSAGLPDGLIVWEERESLRKAAETAAPPDQSGQNK